MTTSTSSPVIALITEAFDLYSRATGQSATVVAVNLLGGKDSDRAAVEAVSATFDLLTERHREVQEARSTGTTRETWLSGELMKAAADAVGLPAALAEGLSGANKALSDGAAPAVEHFGATQVDGFNAGSLAGELCRGIQDNIGLNVPQVQGVESMIPEAVKEVPFAKEYLEAAIGDARDKDANVLTTAALMKAQQSGYFDAVPGFKEATPEHLALMVDRGLTTAKLAYKLAKGELTLGDVKDFLVDRGVATLSVFVTKGLSAAGGKVGMAIGASVFSVFGPAGTAFGAMVGKAVGNLAGHGAAHLINDGVRTIAKGVKNWVRAGVQQVGARVSRVARAVGVAFSALFA